MLQWLIVYARQEYFKPDNSKADDIHNKGANVFYHKTLPYAKQCGLYWREGT